MYDVDVCIVGGGPAGVIAAHAISSAGYSCTIVDKKKRELIGDKNCGDAVDGLFVDLLESELGVKPPSVELGEARELIKKITFAVISLLFI